MADDTQDSGSAIVKQTPKGGISAVGSFALDPTETGTLLQRMQKIVEERESPLNLLLSGLKDAAAAAVPNLEGRKTQAMATRDEQKMKEAQDLFRMRQEMAALKSASAQAEANRASFAGQLGLGPMAGGAAPTAATPGAGTTAASAVTPGGLPAGYDPGTLNEVKRLFAIRGREGEAEALHQKELARLADASAKARFGAAENTKQKYFIPGIGEVDLTPNEWNALPAHVKDKISKYTLQQFGELPPSSTDVTTKQATAGESRNFNPGNIKFGKFAQSQGATGQDSRGFAIFPNEVAGEKAQHNLLAGSDYDMPIKKVPAKWAPLGDGQNDPVAYANSIQKLTGFDDATMNKRYADLTTDQQAAFRAAQKRIEHGSNIITAPADVIKQTAQDKAVTVKADLPPQAKDYPNKSAYDTAVKLYEEKQKQKIELEGTAPKAEATEAGKGSGEALTDLRKQTERANSTMAAADRVIAMADDPKLKKVMGYLHGGDKTATALSTIPSLAASMVGQGEKLEDKILQNVFDKKELAAYQQLQTDATQLGIQYTADMFKGARLGIGLEKLGLKGKGVSAEFLPETNKLYASLAKEAAQFEIKKNDAFIKWHDKTGGTYQQFLDSDTYIPMRDAERERLLNTYKGIVHPEPISGETKKTKSGVSYKVL